MRGVFEFGVLGPLEVRLDGDVVPIRAAKQRTLLAALLADANHTVLNGELISQLWDGEPPDRARAVVQSYVMRLRQVLGAGGGPTPIVTRPDGYEIEVDENHLDLTRFQSLLREAASAQAAADPGRRGALLADALALWRGDPLSNVASRLLHQQSVPVWSEQRLAALEARIDADLETGSAAELLAELRDLTARHPLRERFWAQRMLALYRSGSTAQALACFHEASARLADELGVDPGPQLRDLHQAVLTDDKSVLLPAPPGAAAEPAASGSPRPAAGRNDLPADIADFAGRAPELAELTRCLREEAGSAETIEGEADEAASSGTAVVISAIDGMGGIGKTALAVRAAHRLAGRYPDAQLFLDLHGHTPAREPLDPSVALETLLRAVGVEAADSPGALEERAARWRAELVGRRILLVLDNAAGVAQVRPLLPGTAGSLVLITSRQRLVDLETARTISLDVLPEEDALTLFARIAGADRVAAEPDATADVLRLCGHLPLAVRIAAARLRARSAWSVAHLAKRLGESGRRLAELQTTERGVASTFALSYQYLNDRQQRVFRMLGLCPGPTFDAYLAAAIAGTSVDEAARILEELVDAHLIELAAPERYRFHDLIREHARTAAEQTEPPAARREALIRALHYYMYTAHQADVFLYPGHEHAAPHTGQPPDSAPAFADVEQSLAWFADEHRNLLSAVLCAADGAMDEQCWQLALNLWSYLRYRGLVDQWRMALEAALTAATRLGDRKVRADTLRYLGIAAWESGRYDDALDLYRRSLVHYRAAADRTGEAAALANTGLVLWRLERDDEALEHQHRALDLYTALGAQWGQAAALTNIALVETRLGRHAEALDCNERALALYRAAGDANCEAGTLSNIGMIYQRLGRYDEALAHQHQAVMLAARTQHPALECELRNDLADTYRAAGRFDEARPHYEAALCLAAEAGDPFEEARACEGLGDTLADVDASSAQDRWRRSLEIYARLGVPQADPVREKLRRQ